MVGFAALDKNNTGCPQDKRRLLSYRIDLIKEYIQNLQAELEHMPTGEIGNVIDVLLDARCRGAHIFIMGNVGSAATASHLVHGLLNNTSLEGMPEFKVIGLTENQVLSSAIVNDNGYEEIFAKQLAVLANPGDIVIAISTSGNSRNIIKAIEFANKIGAVTIAFTGFDGGMLGSMADLELCVSSNSTERIEDMHLVLEHIICSALREEVKNTLPSINIAGC
jgi:D-sedoheptulose 7-phosphate isomerase